MRVFEVTGVILGGPAVGTLVREADLPDAGRLLAAGYLRPVEGPQDQAERLLDAEAAAETLKAKLADKDRELARLTVEAGELAARLDDAEARLDARKAEAEKAGRTAKGK